jgi:3-keto-disaccharide hydrolase
MKLKVLFISGLSFIGFSSSGQSKNIQLYALKDGENSEVFNRSMTPLKDGSRLGLSLDERDGDGLVWLKSVTFKEGTIEVDVRGKNKPGQSFVGIAFHGSDNETFDAVYFRPFNFQSQDLARKSHSVQYISAPQYSWSVLREKFPGKYENELTESVRPDDWFHARIEIHGNTITVYVNNGPKPSLTVEKLGNHQAGKLGLWVGNSSAGDFSNLVIKSD